MFLDSLFAFYYLRTINLHNFLLFQHFIINPLLLMGCGNVTPSNTLQVQKDQSIQSIKVSKIFGNSKKFIEYKNFDKGKTFQKSHSKKELNLPKMIKIFDSKSKNYINTHDQSFSPNPQRKAFKKQNISIEDIPQSNGKKKKNVKFQDEARPSIQLRAIDKKYPDGKNNFKVFQKQNANCKKLVKKPRFLVQKARTLKQQTSNTDRDFSGSKQNDCSYESARVTSPEANMKLPKIKRVHTEDDDEYLQSLKEIVLFGDAKNNETGKKNIKINEERGSHKINGSDEREERLDFKKKKKDRQAIVIKNQLV